MTVEPVVDVAEEPELEFDNYEIDKELLESGDNTDQDQDQDEGDIVEFIDNAIEHNDDGEDTEFPLEPHEQMLALEDE